MRNQHPPIEPGMKYGLWLVLDEQSRKEGSKHFFWRCLCECGTKRIVREAALKQGYSRSCGCMRGGLHGIPRVRAHKSWESLKQRCLNPNATDYDKYGGRGVTVCERWQHSFEAFLADMGERPAGTTLDRIDGSGNYDPGNCRWATVVRQNRNKPGGLHIAIDGVAIPFRDWCDRHGVPYTLAEWRLKEGWPIERMADPPRPKRPNGHGLRAGRKKRITLTVTIGAVTKPLKQWCAEKSLSYGLVWNRMKAGWPAERLLDPITPP